MINTANAVTTLPTPTSNELIAMYEALNKVQAIIEFQLDGTVITANENFLNTFGYRLDEIVGQHHQIFCEPSYVKSVEYQDFWEKLRRGEYHTGEFKRLSKDGEKVWIQASYSPILDTDGNPIKIVKLASDITEDKVKNAEFEGKILAIAKSQAMIEFDLEGIILNANGNFLNAFGYHLDEIVGQHHRIFCDPSYAESIEYQKFWEKLGRGEYHAGEFKRFSKDGNKVWIQASYNPILDADGHPIKIVKLASDITSAKVKNADFEGKMSAISKSQAMIEFDLEGIVLNANENFLQVFGYKLEDVVGQHHRIFCDPNYTASEKYKQFWQKLTRGEYESGEVQRFNKVGEEIWLQASYNPIFDEEGKLTKVVKFASDITAEVERKRLSILEMSTPITEISNDLLLMPIVGMIDYQRSMDIMNKALNSIAKTSARALILDISGVNVVDTEVANRLIKIAEAIVLMGGNTIISGISPAIAQTMVQLGIDLKKVKTTARLQDAIASLMKTS
ncbi:MAG: PAS domain S-box protein [Spirulina sp. SIO3F2]|nr:PAS domain S-box protein [Spirulina sp. SIO3F2]